MKKSITFESWITSFIEKLSDYFNLAGWNIWVEFHKDIKGDSYAETSIDSTYLTATIHFYKQAKEDFSKKDIQWLVTSVVHEMTHIFLDPFHEYVVPFLSPSTSDLFMNLLETQTQKITMVFMKNLPEDIIPPR
jgi:hypothetical protein